MGHFRERKGPQGENTPTTEKLRLKGVVRWVFERNRLRRHLWRSNGPLIQKVRRAGSNPKHPRAWYFQMFSGRANFSQGPKPRLFIRAVRLPTYAALSKLGGLAWRQSFEPVRILGSISQALDLVTLGGSRIDEGGGLCPLLMAGGNTHSHLPLF